MVLCSYGLKRKNELRYAQWFGMLHIGAWEPVEHCWSDFTIEKPRFSDQDPV